MRQNTMMSPRQVRGNCTSGTAVLGTGRVAARSRLRLRPGRAPPRRRRPTSAAQAAVPRPPASPGAASLGPRRPPAGRDRVRQREPGHLGHRAPESCTWWRPTRAAALAKTQHNVTLVARAVRSVSARRCGNPSSAKGIVSCPADFGISYLGDVLRRPTGRWPSFTYGVTGCQMVSLTTGGTTKSTMVLGAAAGGRAEAAGRHGRGSSGCPRWR